MAQWPVFSEVSSAKGIADVEAISYLYGNGAAIADYDGDGDLDFFLCTEGGIADKLYQNDGAGFFTDVADQLGLSSTKRTRVALWLDYDGDEDLDLISLSDCYLEGCDDPITISFYEQRNNGSFTEVSKDIGLELGDKYDTNLSIAPGGLAAGDLNNDGYLDLIISVWGGPMTYFENTSNGGFTDKSDSSLLGPDFQYRWQPMIADFNEDGFQDIYMNVDFEANEFWLNNGDGTFTDIAASSLSDSAFNEMGLTIGDYDNDGDFDLYATNISREDNGELRHNILLKNLWSSTGVLIFDELANDLQLGASGWDWGTTFFDANNDGQLDLVTTNGWTPDGWGIDLSRLWLNLGDGLFGDISNTSQFSDELDATSLMAFDMDRDGDLDLLQTLKENSSTSAALQLYENSLNETSQPGNYIVVKPRQENANHFAIGTVVKLTTDNSTQMRLISAGTSLYGQEPAEAYFGLGDANAIIEIKVLWPDQTETIVKDVNVNQVLTITKQNLSVDKNPIQNSIRFYPNPTSQLIVVDNLSMEVSYKIFNALGQEVTKGSLDTENYTIDMEVFGNGWYYLRLFDSTGKYLVNTPVIKQ
ncbi:FG-GAP-like repeat-containing protein [Winogradskyella aurantiaca]|uniref:FG-GAP-like repeat-containing protein n=1 Tax=Winogradskyella aurantiaca TaxID=2219558 RepID=UPI0018E5110A|nr:FG-GAP-like repeat-containing protein [Winogradskyella aurantiaca]